MSKLTSVPQTLGVYVNVTLMGMTPSATVAVHIHEAGDMASTDGTATLGHFNPFSANHSCTGQRHVGDLGNVVIDSSGNGFASFVAPNASLSYSMVTSYILGRAIIVHSQADDCHSQPTGPLLDCVLGSAHARA